MNQPHLVPVARAAIPFDFVVSAQDSSQTLAVLLTALAKLSEPGSVAHDLAAHALAIANTLAADAGEISDAWMH